MRNVEDARMLSNSALVALATNELQMLYLFTRWAGCTDVGYTMHGCKKKGDAFKPVTFKQVMFAMKQMKSR